MQDSDFAAYLLFCPCGTVWWGSVGLQGWSCWSAAGPGWVQVTDLSCYSESGGFKKTTTQKVQKEKHWVCVSIWPTGTWWLRELLHWVYIIWICLRCHRRCWRKERSSYGIPFTLKCALFCCQRCSWMTPFVALLAVSDYLSTYREFSTERPFNLQNPHLIKKIRVWNWGKFNQLKHKSKAGKVNLQAHFCSCMQSSRLSYLRQPAHWSSLFASV